MRAVSKIYVILAFLLNLDMFDIIYQVIAIKIILKIYLQYTPFLSRSGFYLSFLFII